MSASTTEDWAHTDMARQQCQLAGPEPDEDLPLQESSLEDPDYRRSRALASCSDMSGDGVHGVLLPSGSFITLHAGEVQDMQDAYEAQEAAISGLATTVAAVGTKVSASIINSIDKVSTYLVEMSQHLGGFPQHEAGQGWSDDHMQEVRAPGVHGACTGAVVSSSDALHSRAQLGNPLKHRAFQTTIASSGAVGRQEDVSAAACAVSSVESKAVRMKVAHISAISMFDADDWYVAGHDPADYQVPVQHRKDD